MAPNGDIRQSAREVAASYPSRKQNMVNCDASTDPSRDAETKLHQKSVTKSIPKVWKSIPKVWTSVARCHQENRKGSTTKMRRRRKQLVLPTKSQKKNIKEKANRQRQKQASSLQNLFQNKEQELLFRYGPTYRKFVLPQAQTSALGRGMTKQPPPPKRAEPNVGKGRFPPGGVATRQQPRSSQTNPNSDDGIRELVLEPKPKWIRALWNK